MILLNKNTNKNINKIRTKITKKIIINSMMMVIVY